MTTTLSVLEAALPDAQRRGDDVALTDATHDSRQAGAGTLFCAIRGARVDGHDHAAAAAAAGSPALLVERWLEVATPQLRVTDVRAAAGPVAALIHGEPSRSLRLVGVTGTNGKTTTAYLLEAAFGANAWGTGLIGTIETRIHGAAQSGVRTTPEGTDLQRLLARMRDRGVEAVAMEVSSHGLDLHRVDGCHFAVAVFTNLSQDHLDWHGTMERYFATKARLFTPALSVRGVVCTDDEWGRRLARTATIPVTTFGATDEADVRLVDPRTDLAGGAVTLDGPDGPVELTTRLLGGFNLRNLAGAYLAAVAAGVTPGAARAGLAAAAGVPGRLERVGDGDVTVLVDYAHTPDALVEVLAAVRRLLPPGGALSVVVGCGGDRDRGKRPLMGAAAATADLAVLTSDNPRSEDPLAILDEVVAGARAAVAGGAAAALEVEPDRRRAITEAIRAARPGDVVVVAGKGHETVQEFADHTEPFDDRLVAAEALAGAARGGLA